MVLLCSSPWFVVEERCFVTELIGLIRDEDVDGGERQKEGRPARSPWDRTEGTDHLQTLQEELCQKC